MTAASRPLSSMEANDVDDLSHFLPRFRWGNVAPTQVGQRVRRGPTYQFYKIVPNDVMEIDAGRGLEEELEAGHFDQAKTNYWDAVQQLAEEKADIIIIGGVPVSANFGRPEILAMIEQTKATTGIPATSPAEAILAGMHHLGLRSVTIGSRWGDELNQKLVRYITEGGIEVATITTRAQSVAVAHRMSFEEGLDTSLAVGREAAAAAPNADAILVPGGAAMSLHVIPVLEQEFGKPVITNLSAEVWQVLVHPAIIPPVQGWGALLAQP